MAQCSEQMKKPSTPNKKGAPALAAAAHWPMLFVAVVVMLALLARMRVFEAVKLGEVA